MAYVKFVSTKRRHEDWTQEYKVLDSDGEEVVVKRDVPVDLSAAMQRKLESIGAVFTTSSKKEADDYEKSLSEQFVVGADVAAAAPLLGAGGNQNVDQPTADSDLEDDAEKVDATDQSVAATSSSSAEATTSSSGGKSVKSDK